MYMFSFILGPLAEWSSGTTKKSLYDDHFDVLSFGCRCNSEEGIRHLSSCSNT